jgi:MFS family permease
MINQKLQYRLIARNTRYSFIDGATFSFMLGSTVPYLGLYILRFHGPAELVSLIAAIQPIVLAVISLLAASYVNRFVRKKTVLMPYSLILRLFILVMALIPFLPKTWHAWTFFVLWGVMFIPWAFCGLSWSPMICNIIPEEMRGRFFGTRNALTGFTTLLGTCLTGLILMKIPFLPAFSIIFTLGFAGTMVSLYFLNKHIEPVAAEYASPVESKGSGWMNFKANFRTFTHPQYGYHFSLCCLAVFVFHIGYSMAVPLYTIRQVTQLQFNDFTISLIMTASGLAALFGSYAGGRSTDRFGYRNVLLYSTLISVIPPLLWSGLTQLPWLIVASMLAGFTGNAYLICFYYMVLAVSPQEERSRFVAMNTFVGNLAGAIGPLIGMLLIKTPGVGIQGALITASLIMLLGAVFSFNMAKRCSF